MSLKPVSQAKRTARKVAARVRPTPGVRPKSKLNGTSKKGGKKRDFGSESGDQLDPMEEDYEEPNADDSILQFNCGELLNFSTGGVVLPMRITCYCRHHKEKIGFKYVSFNALNLFSELYLRTVVLFLL